MSAGMFVTVTNYTDMDRFAKRAWRDGITHATRSCAACNTTKPADRHWLASIFAPFKGHAVMYVICGACANDLALRAKARTLAETTVRDAVEETAQREESRSK